MDNEINYIYIDQEENKVKIEHNGGKFKINSDYSNSKHRVQLLITKLENPILFLNCNLDESVKEKIYQISDEYNIAIVDKYYDL